MRFKKDMSIIEAVNLDPRAREVFARYGMGCLGCLAATIESIEEGALAHGIDPDKLINELNKLTQEDE